MRDNCLKCCLIVTLIQATPLYADISNPNPTPWVASVPGVSTMSTTSPPVNTATASINTTQSNTQNSSTNTANNSQALTQSALETFMNLTYQKLSTTASQNSFQSEDSSKTDPNFHVFEGHS